MSWRDGIVGEVLQALGPELRIPSTHIKHDR